MDLSSSSTTRHNGDLLSININEFENKEQTTNSQCSFISSIKTILPIQPSTHTHSEPSTPTPIQPSTPVPIQPSTPTHTEPSTRIHTESSTPIPIQPSTHLPIQPSTPTHTEPSTRTPIQLSTLPHTEPSTPVPTLPSTPLPTLPSTPVPSLPSTPVPSLPSTPLPTLPIETKDDGLTRPQSANDSVSTDCPKNDSLPCRVDSDHSKDDSNGVSQSELQSYFNELLLLCESIEECCLFTQTEIGNNRLAYILNEIAVTGTCRVPWNLVKVIIALRFYTAFEEYNHLMIPYRPAAADGSADEVAVQIIDYLFQFDRPILCVQRLCELIMWGNRWYGTCNKWIAACRKCLEGISMTVYETLPFDVIVDTHIDPLTLVLSRRLIMLEGSPVSETVTESMSGTYDESNVPMSQPRTSIDSVVPNDVVKSESSEMQEDSTSDTKQGMNAYVSIGTQRPYPLRMSVNYEGTSKISLYVMSQTMGSMGSVTSSSNFTSLLNPVMSENVKKRFPLTSDIIESRGMYRRDVSYTSPNSSDATSDVWNIGNWGGTENNIGTGFGTSSYQLVYNSTIGKFYGQPVYSKSPMSQNNKMSNVHIGRPKKNNKRRSSICGGSDYAPSPKRVNISLE